MFSFIHVSNLVTYMSLAFGILAVLESKGNAYALTAFFIGASCLCDLFDGLWASRFKRGDNEKKVGAELDSLSDAIVFGAVPVFSLVACGQVGILFYLCSLAYFISCVTRLSYYNVFSQEDREGFLGIPTTIIGILWMPVFLIPSLRNLTSVWLIIFAGLMVMPVKIRRPGRTFFISLVCVLLAWMLWSFIYYLRG